ncbi:CPBP family intramembrane metalloprotease domain-containing protein [Natronococcus pandeyae]|uniref:CPBP family intramembrane metalloprotease domain-containing protein n=1 Tax=Natronococcus pandeyae TaxID=2055836 RepID=A0A8J8Q3B2_9EURY|nr:CPBP family intramembrane metalloprotease domain-containing protein [Natronococcus pandeyae]
MSRYRSHQPAQRAAKLVRATAPWGFPLLYLGWAYLFWLPVVASEASVYTYPNVVLLLVGGSSPLLAGLVLLWINHGRAGFADLRRRLLELGRISGRWWLIILLFYPVFNLGAAGVALLTGFTAKPLEFIGPDRLFDPGALFFLLAVALLFPAIEEIGLRGYWFDQLQARWSALVSSLILGTVWALWHVPLVYMSGYYEGTTFQPELWWWLPSIVLTAIIGTWIYNNTARSVLAVIVFHFLGNLTGETIGFAPELYPVVHIGTAIVALALVIWFGSGSLRGRDMPQPLPDWVTVR